MRIRRRLLAGAATLVAGAAALVSLWLPTSAPAATGLHTLNGQLVEGNGNLMVLHGVNLEYHPDAERTATALADIKALGANSVRILIPAGTAASPALVAADVTGLISMCRANGLICVLTLSRPALPGGAVDGAGVLAAATQYWIAVADALDGQEDYVMIDIAGDPWGDGPSTRWTDATTTAIRALRGAGISGALLVEGPDRGQDTSQTMRDNALSVFTADPDRNTIFAVHMYDGYGTDEAVTSYLDAYRDRGLPLLVGEFGYTDVNDDVDEATIFSYARDQEVGLMAWSWCGNSGPFARLDLKAGGCDGDGSLTAWGQQVKAEFEGTREATVYSGDEPVPPQSDRYMAGGALVGARTAARPTSATTPSCLPGDTACALSDGASETGQTTGTSTTSATTGSTTTRSTTSRPTATTRTPGPGTAGANGPVVVPGTLPSPGGTSPAPDPPPATPGRTSEPTPVTTPAPPAPSSSASPTASPADPLAANGSPYCVAGRYLDGDADGWGWQDNSVACVVAGSRADPAVAKAANGFPYCNAGRYIDGDGDGWGWENNAFSCVVRGSAADPAA